MVSVVDYTRGLKLIVVEKIVRFSDPGLSKTDVEPTQIAQIYARPKLYNIKDDSVFKNNNDPVMIKKCFLNIKTP